MILRPFDLSERLLDFLVDQSSYGLLFAWTMYDIGGSWQVYRFWNKDVYCLEEEV